MASGPINDLEQVFANPQVKVRGMQLEVPHPLSGTVPQVANPIRLSETQIEHHAAPPTLGQHTNDIPCDLLEMNEDEVAKLARKGIT